MHREELTFDTIGMSQEDVAKTFAAYLLGEQVYKNETSAEGRHRWGPYPPERGSDSWQLNESNDYWLHFNSDGTAWLNYRYESGYEVCLTMKRLFELRYILRRSQGAQSAA